MKKMMFAATVACAGALAILAVGQAQAEENWSDLKLATNDWFSAAVSGTSVAVVGGSFAPDPTVKDGKITFERVTVGSPIVFTTGDTHSSTSAITSVTFDVDAAVVRASDTNTVASGKIGFMLQQASSSPATNFVAWIGGTRTVLTPAVEIDEGARYKMHVFFDDRDAEHGKVMFVSEIGSTSTTLKNGEEEWIDYGTKLPLQRHVAVAGTGTMTGFAANQYTILAAVIVTTNGTVDVKTEDVPAVEAAAAASGKTVAEYMQSPAKAVVSGFPTASPLTVNQAYALGLVASNSEGDDMQTVNNGVLTIKAESTQVSADGVKVAFFGAVPKTDCGATYAIKIMGSATGESWTQVGSATDPTNIVIPTSALTDCHYFKVETTVTLKDENLEPKN